LEEKKREIAKLTSQPLTFFFFASEKERKKEKKKKGNKGKGQEKHGSRKEKPLLLVPLHVLAVTENQGGGRKRRKGKG